MNEKTIQFVFSLKTIVIQARNAIKEFMCLHREEHMHSLQSTNTEY